MTPEVPIGTRGDVEPCAAVNLELVRRGHEVRMAIPETSVTRVADLLDDAAPLRA
jgi:UDP:flavonoid glycosyltransferase YjiC (YdhE family)